MDKISVLTAPLYAVFSKDFYRQVIQSRLSRGFLYLLYLSILATLIFGFVTATRVLPQIDRFMEWAKNELPPLVWTPAGLEMNAQSPYVMVHPDLGPLIYFDMAVTEVTAEQMSQTPVFVTASKIYVRQPNQTRIYDVTAQGLRVTPQSQPLEITGEFVDGLYGTYKPWGITIIVFSFWLIFFLFKLLEVFISSLIGLVINSFRAIKLSYRAVLNVCFFAITASVVLEALKVLLPAIRFVPSGILVNLIITGAYLFMAVKLTEETPASGTPG